MRTATVLAAALLVAGTPSQAEHAYIPIAFAPALMLPPESYRPETVWWRTTHSFTNTTDTTLTAQYVRVIGSPGSIGPGCDGGPLIVPPRTLWRISDIGGSGCASSGHGPGFLELDLDPGVVVSGGIHLVTPHSCGDPSAIGEISLASAPLPVYRALFPGGATAASLGLPPLPSDPSCTNPRAPVARRVNLTVANGGLETATVSVRASGASAEPLVFFVPAGTPLQLNDLFPEGSYEVLLVTSSQPFLAYASSVTTYADPDQIPSLAVYSFRPLD